MVAAEARIVAVLTLPMGGTNDTLGGVVSQNWTAYLDGGSAKWHIPRLLAEAREARAVQSNIQIGYMNVHHQRVLAHARIRGDKNTGFVMWCSKCQRSYVACDGEVQKCRCPLHDYGAPALAADSPTVEWLS
jgi:hypothetical protein